MAVSPPVISDQTGPHTGLRDRVRKYRGGDFKKPIADHTKRAFDQARNWLDKRGVDPSRSSNGLVIDSGCGRGDSSYILAQRWPDAHILGIDKSANRLGRDVERPSNDRVLLLRADLIDFFLLSATAHWRLDAHAIFYPNPWPKSEHLGRRWQAHPIFPLMLQLGGKLELRSNWRIYAEEFKIALSEYGISAQIQALPDADPVSLHERKYKESGHDLVVLTADLDVAN